MKHWILLIGIALVLSGCQTGTTGYRSPDGLPYPGVADPRAPRATILPHIVPTPLPTKGTVTGYLFRADTGSPISGISLYFANLLPLTPGPEFFVTLDPVNSPHIPVAADGWFIMTNIAPGKYALVLWTPQRASYVLDPNAPEKMLTVEIQAGQTLDLGEMTVTLP